MCHRRSWEGNPFPLKIISKLRMLRSSLKEAQSSLHPSEVKYILWAEITCQKDGVIVFSSFHPLLPNKRLALQLQGKYGPLVVRKRGRARVSLVHSELETDLACTSSCLNKRAGIFRAMTQWVTLMQQAWKPALDAQTQTRLGRVAQASRTPEHPRANQGRWERVSRGKWTS